MSGTLATILHELEPDWRIAIVERMDRPALESSGPWHNAGTGHAALCELNYTPQAKDGSVSIAKAENVHRQWVASLAYWAHLVEQGTLDPSFIQTMPHMSFVQGEAGADFLKKRVAALDESPLFKDRLTYSEDRETIAGWAPLLLEGREASDKVAVTHAPAGTDVNFGLLTEQLIANSGAEVSYNQRVKNLKQASDGTWTATVKGKDGVKRHLHSKFVFVGAGGDTLPLLQKSGIKEIRGYGGFPVSGQFWATDRVDAVANHKAKVYGQAAVGAPPMSVPHLDARHIDNADSLLFGPFAGFSTRFLKNGSLLDLFRSIRWHNIMPLLSVAVHNMSLTWYLITEVLKTKKSRYREVSKFYPEAKIGDWRQVTAGQRVQVIRPKGKLGGSLEFGTEVIVKDDGTIAGLLGASPGASTTVAIMFDTLGRAFPEKKDEWAARLGSVATSWAGLDDSALREVADTSRAALKLV